MSKAKSTKDAAFLRTEAGDLHAFLLDRLEAMLGLLEWLSVDLLKKGAAKKAERIDQMTELLDGYGNRAERLERGFRESPCTAMEHAPLEALNDWAQHHEAFRIELGDFEKKIIEMTADGALFSEEDLVGLFGSLERLDAGIRADEEALTVSPES